MKQLFVGAVACTATLLTACQGNNTQNEEAKKYASEAIALHDEIMPQISVFAKHDILVDSLLQNLAALKSADAELDTAEVHQKLQSLKTKLESANDKMMDWMNEYTPDSIDASYQQAEAGRLSALKTEFDQVKYEAESLLAPYKK